jgi:MAC/Perforin domain-containing protein
VVAGVSYDLPEFVKYLNEMGSEFTSVFGESKTDYLANLTAKAGIEGKYKLFTGSFETDFSEESAQNIANAFTRISCLVKSYVLKLPTIHDYEKLREVLDEDFVKDVNTADPARFFQDYGTHMIGSILVGGRASFLYTTDSSTFKHSKSIEVTAKMSSECMMGNTDTQYKEAKEAMLKSSEYQVATVGGDPRYGNQELLQNVQQWEGSVKDYLR